MICQGTARRSPDRWLLRTGEAGRRRVRWFVASLSIEGGFRAEHPTICPQDVNPHNPTAQLVRRCRRPPAPRQYPDVQIPICGQPAPKGVDRMAGPTELRLLRPSFEVANADQFHKHLRRVDDLLRCDPVGTHRTVQVVQDALFHQDAENHAEQFSGEG